MNNYKDTKQSFDAGGQGSSGREVMAIWTALLLTHLLWRTVDRRFAAQIGCSGRPCLLIQFIILVLPLLAITTILADRLWSTNLALTILVGFLSLVPPTGQRARTLDQAIRQTTSEHSHLKFSPPPIQTFTPSSLSCTPIRVNRDQPIEKRGSLRRRTVDSHDFLLSDLADIVADARDEPIEPIAIHFYRPFLTIYRSQLMLLTSICILAVDFRIFPRRFAKTETWGLSIMDSGVGSFVFSLGIISALPIVKRSPISRSLTVDIWQSTKKTIPLLVLGLVRILFVKGVDYPEHVTEYGVHWNFFFTLSILPMAGVLARRIFESYRVNLALVGLSLSLVFQLLLSLGGLQEYVLSSIPRTNLIAANREGLISLPGYLIIYLFGLSTGCYLLPPSPSFLQKIGRNPNTPSSLKSTPQLGKSLVVCSSWSIIWWTLYLLFNTFVSPASRRLANPTYCFWIVANNLTVITGHGLIHQLDLTRQPSPRVTTPKLFEAINQNSLAVFLIANLMTGLINVSVHTIYLSNLVSIVILIGYTILVVCFSWKIKRFKLKF